jgi:hypothetical protein
MFARFLVGRYSSSTIVTMLREIARCKSAKLDWVVLCKGTATGIRNPKEYQAVWRSIAYHSELDDSFEGNESPLVCSFPSRFLSVEFSLFRVNGMLL